MFWFIRNILSMVMYKVDVSSIPRMHRRMLCSYVESSVVEHQPLHRESPGSNPLCCHFEAWEVSFTLRRPSSLICQGSKLRAIGRHGRLKIVRGE